MALIYKIVDNTNGNCYIGSTKLELKKRIQNHEAACRRYVKGNTLYSKSYEIIKNNNYSVFELEKVDDENLRYCRERYFIECVNGCINKNIPTRNKAEYYLTYQEDIKEYQRKKYQDNIDFYRDNKLLRYSNGSYRYQARNRYDELMNYRYLNALIISELDDKPLEWYRVRPAKQHERACYSYIQKMIINELEKN